MFDLPHLSVICLVVVAHQMEESVDEEQGDLLLGGVTQFLRFGLGMIQRDDDRPQREVLMLPFEGEAEHIGSFVDVAVGAVELLYGGIVAENELNLPLCAGIGNGLEQSSIEGIIGVVISINHAVVYQKSGKIR